MLRAFRITTVLSPYEFELDRQSDIRGVKKCIVVKGSTKPYP
jgi:hypothetical protein